MSGRFDMLVATRRGKTMSRETINARRMYHAIAEMDSIEFAIVVGGFAFDLKHNEDADAESIITKWWHWTDEIAQSLLDDNEEEAIAKYNLMLVETCQECFVDTDKYDGETYHFEECSKA
jgi:hypothetical protein